MATCTHCGKERSWLRSVRAGGQTFCSGQCRDEWLNNRREEQRRAEEEQRRAEEEQRRAEEERRRAEEEKRRAAEEEKRRAEQEQRRAEEEQRRAEKKKERRERERELRPIRARIKALEKEIRKTPRDPYLRIELATARAKLPKGRKGAIAAYEAAFALSVPNPRELGIARWEYAKLLFKPDPFDVRRKWGRKDLESMARYRRVTEPEYNKQFLAELPDIAYQLREGTNALKRHLRYEPDDTEALETLVKMGKLLGSRSTAGWEHQLRIAKKRSRMSRARSAKPKSKTDKTGVAFEERCLTVVRSLGFTAITTSATADGGIDIMATSDQPLLRGRVAIQCKDWQDPVGEPVLRDLLGVVTAEDALKGILITSSTFTPAALRFADGKRLELIDGKELSLIEQMATD